MPHLEVPEVLGGPPGTTFGPNWSDWAGIMVTTHLGLVWGLFWATRDPKRAFLASKRPKNDVFGRFLELDGSKRAVIA